jgi:hypothetical protein
MIDFPGDSTETGTTSLRREQFVFRWTLLLIAIWSVIAAPALCVAGVLAHECHCEDEIACDHESACESDPCSEMLLRRDSSAGDVLITAFADALPVTRLEWPENPSLPPSAPAASLAIPLVGVRHASDLPLLS